jgi:hypothetical protein
VRGVTPILLLLLVAGHAIAGSGSAAASHAGEGPLSVERIAGIALTVLLVLGLAGLKRHKR